MSPEEQARLEIDRKLKEAGWVLQDVKDFNAAASLGVAVREFATDTGPVDYLLFVDRKPAAVVEAKKSAEGQNITIHEEQSHRYATSNLKWSVKQQPIRFAYEATDVLTRFTDYHDEKPRSREVFSFYRPETLNALAQDPETLLNRLKQFPDFDAGGFRDCQTQAILRLEKSFGENRPNKSFWATLQMTTPGDLPNFTTCAV